MRGERSRASVTTQLASFGIVLDQSALSKYEKEGRVPPIDVVRGLALVYRQPFTALVDLLLREHAIEAVDWQKEVGPVTEETVPIYVFTRADASGLTDVNQQARQAAVADIPQTSGIEEAASSSRGPGPRQRSSSR